MIINMKPQLKIEHGLFSECHHGIIQSDRETNRDSFGKFRGGMKSMSGQCVLITL